MRNMVFTTFGRFTVVAHTKKPPSEEEWHDYIMTHKAYFERGMSMRFVIFTEGGAPTATQRQKMTDIVAEWARSNPDCIRSAIVTRSSLVRGVVTAISWFLPIARAFSPENVEQAFAYLEIPPEIIPEIQRVIPLLKAQLTPENPPAR